MLLRPENFHSVYHTFLSLLQTTTTQLYEAELLLAVNRISVSLSPSSHALAGHQSIVSTKLSTGDNILSKELFTFFAIAANVSEN